MKSLPLVSVLVPVFNGDRYLDEALRCAQRQTYRNLEIIVRDDGSDDDSGLVAESFCSRDSRFTYIPGGTRRLGGTGNMVELLGLASGEFVKFLHQDDRLEPACVERLVRPLRFDDSLTMATSSRYRIDAAGNTTPTAPVAYQPLQAGNGKLAGADMVRRMVTTLTNQLGEPSVALFRNGVVAPEHAFVLDEITYSYLNDVALWTNLLLAGDLYWHALPLSSFRSHESQRSAQLSESVTLAAELAAYLRFGVTHHFIHTEAELQRGARQVTEFLHRIHPVVSSALPIEQAELSAGLALAIARVQALLASGDGSELLGGPGPSTSTAGASVDRSSECV